MRGSEDLGGGKKANFHLESDILTNSGNTHSAGLFRRAANVSLADAKLGEVFLGRRGNAYIIATGQMLPVQGNTAHQWRNVILSSVGDQISNSVSYATPEIMKTNVLVQYGMNNTIDNGDDGSMFAAHLVNKSINGLQITAAYNNMKGLRAAQTGAGQGAISAANITTTNREGYAVGVKYKITPAIEAGTFYAHGRNNNGTSVGAATSGISSGAGGFGLGYQATPSILLGANYVKTTFQAQMTNLQAHYMLSKRTRVYSQITLTQAAKGNQQLGTLAASGFSPIACNSSANTSTTTGGTTTSAGCNNALPGTAGFQNVPTNANGYNIGIIHTF
jgi:predicted porin